MSTIILGDGPLGTAIEAALRARGEPATIRGRPRSGRHDPRNLTRTEPTVDVIVDASRAEAVLANVEAGLAAGCRRFVIATTGWADDRAAVASRLRGSAAAAVVAPNLAMGAAVAWSRRRRRWRRRSAASIPRSSNGIAGPRRIGRRGQPVSSSAGSRPICRSPWSRSPSFDRGRCRASISLASTRRARRSSSASPPVTGPAMRPERSRPSTGCGPNRVSPGSTRSTPSSTT